MKCIFVIPRMGGGGAERVVSLLSSALAENGNDITIFTLVGGDSFYELNAKVHFESVGVTVSRKNKLSRMLSELIFLPKSFFALYKRLKSGKYDVVISMLTECDLIVGCCKLFGLRFKHICSERNDPFKRKGIYFSLLKMVYRQASLFVCQGEKVYGFYNTIPESRKRIIPNPVNGDDLPEHVECNSKRVVSVGRLNEQKNFALLIRSFANLGTEFEEYKLDIYGEGPERQSLQMLIDNLEISDRVTLCGAKKNVQMLITDADLYVMSSDYEGFPNALLEAMAMGLPVISTDFPTGIAAELINEENGIVVPTRDEKAMTEAMQTLLKNADIRHSMGLKNKDKCRRYYTKNIITEWEKAIESIL